MSNIQHYILIGNKRYGYTMAPARQYTTIVVKEAGLKLKVPNEQVPQVLAELARQIIANRETAEAQSEVLRFRVTPSEKQQIESAAIEAGFSSVSAYLRQVAVHGETEVTIGSEGIEIKKKE